MVEVRAHGFLAVFAVCGLYGKGRAPSPIVHVLSVAGKLAHVSKRRRAFVALISYGAHRRAVCVSARWASATIIRIAFASFPLLVMTLRGDARRRVPAGLERRLRHPAALAVSARASRHHH